MTPSWMMSCVNMGPVSSISETDSISYNRGVDVKSPLFSGVLPHRVSEMFDTNSILTQLIAQE
jgi:hypothetical protein